MHAQSQTTGGSGSLDAADVTVGIPTRNRSHLLRGAIESVLAQSYRNLVLKISDNASADDTADVVASFGDPRIDYRPLAGSVSRTDNFNRVVELADTPYVLVLADDDELRPDHLSRTAAILKRWPGVGVVHTAYSIVDMRGNTLAAVSDRNVADDDVQLVSGREFLGRSMKQGPQVCLSGTLFRKEALVNAGGLWSTDGVIDDFPLLMRIAAEWDFAFLNTPLAVMRAHEEASSSSLGGFTPSGFRSSRVLPDILYDHRLNAIARTDLPPVDRQRLARVAERSYRRDVLAHLSMRARAGDRRRVLADELKSEVRRDGRLARNPATVRFVLGQLAGRRIRDRIRSVVEHPHRLHIAFRRGRSR